MIKKIKLTPTTKKNIYWLFLTLLAIYLVFNVFAYFELNYLLVGRIDSQLKHEIEHIANTVGFYNDTLFFKSIDEFNETDLVEVTSTPFFLKIYNSKNKILFESKNLGKITRYQVKMPKKFEEDYVFVDKDFYSEELRTGFHKVKNREGNVLGVIELSTFKSSSKILADSFLLFNLITFPFFLIVFAFISYFLVKKSFAPINRIIDLANEISASNISKRLTYEADPNDELGRLKTTLNNLFDRLEYQINQISQFSDNASHQLMTPLTSLKSEIEFLEKSNALRDEGKESLKILHEQTERMISIVRTMLILSKDSDNCGCLKTVFNFSKILEELKNFYNNSRIEFSSKNNIFLRGRGDYFSLVMQNLIDNALKYSDENKKVFVNAKESDSKIIISVEDFGVGISASEREKIFERFYRGRASENRTSGYGLGLSLVRNIVHNMNGKIKIEDNLPQGTKFIIELPKVDLD